jgi:hypothetical protein
MEIVIRIALMFFFIQFLVVVTIMSVALLLARLEVPVLGRMAGRGVISRSFAFVIHLPCQVFRFMLRRMHNGRFFHSIH